MLWQAKSKLLRQDCQISATLHCPVMPDFVAACLRGKYYISVAELLIHTKVRVPVVGLEETIFNYSQCI